jgi:hypothetical protein
VAFNVSGSKLFKQKIKEGLRCHCPTYTSGAIPMQLPRIKFAVRRLLIVVSVFLGVAHPVIAEEPFFLFCRSLLELADEPEVLSRVWDRFRQDERKSPGYRPEPPQTEYQGYAPRTTPRQIHRSTDQSSLPRFSWACHGRSNHHPAASRNGGRIERDQS